MNSFLAAAVPDAAVNVKRRRPNSDRMAGIVSNSLCRVSLSYTLHLVTRLWPGAAARRSLTSCSVQSCYGTWTYFRRWASPGDLWHRWHGRIFFDLRPLEQRVLPTSVDKFPRWVTLLDPYTHRQYYGAQKTPGSGPASLALTVGRYAYCMAQSAEETDAPACHVISVSSKTHIAIKPHSLIPDSASSSDYWSAEVSSDRGETTDRFTGSERYELCFHCVDFETVTAVSARNNGQAVFHCLF